MTTMNEVRERKGPLRWLREKLDNARMKRVRLKAVRKMIAGELPPPEVGRLFEPLVKETGRDGSSPGEQKKGSRAAGVRLELDVAGKSEPFTVDVDGRTEVDVGDSVLLIEADGIYGGFNVKVIDGKRVAVTVREVCCSGDSYVGGGMGGGVDCDVDADVDSDVDCDVDCDLDGDVDGDIDVDADMDCDVDGDVDGDFADSDTDSDVDSDSGEIERAPYIDSRFTTRGPRGGIRRGDRELRGFDYSSFWTDSSFNESEITDKSHFKMVYEEAKALCDGKKPGELTEDELREIAKELKSEDGKRRAAVLYLIGRRKAAEHLEHVLRVAEEDGDRLAKSFAFLSLFKLRESGAIEAMLERMHGRWYNRPATNVLMKLRKGGPKSQSILFEAIEQTVNSSWFLEEKKNGTTKYKRTLEFLSNAMEEKPPLVRGYWWMLSTDDMNRFVYDVGESLSDESRKTMLGWRIEELYRAWGVGIDAETLEWLEDRVGMNLRMECDDELMELIINPFSDFYSPEMRRIAKMEFLRSLSDEDRDAIELANGISPDYMTDEELGRVLIDSIAISAQRREGNDG